MGPSPAIVGILEKHDSRFLDEYVDEMDTNDYYENMVIIDVDSNTLTVKLSSEFAESDMPIIKTNNFKRRLEELRSEIHELNVKVDVLSNVVRESTLLYLCQIFNFYEEVIDYRYLDDYNKELDNIVNQDYKPKYYATENSFFNHFFKTNVFQDFVYRKIFPKNLCELAPVALFDETIKKQQLSKFEPIFTNTALYDIKKVIKIQNFDKVATEHMINKIDFQESVIKGNKININKSGGFHFGFYFFPILQYSTTLNLTDFENKIPKSLLEETKNVNEKLLNSFLYKNSKDKCSHEKNNVYLIWLTLFAFCYRMIEPDERENMLKHLFDTIDKVQFFDIKIVNRLFDTLKDSGNEINTKVFRKLIKKGVYPSFQLVSEIKDVLKAGKTEFQLVNKKSMVIGQKASYNGNRTFQTNELTKIFTDKVCFNFHNSCPECEQNLEIAAVPE